MHCCTPLKVFCILGLASLLLTPTLQAKPNTSIKNTLTRAENPSEGTKNRLVLPMGSSRNDSMQHYTLKNGLLQSAHVGGDSWNPMQHGVTTLLLRQYNRYRSLEFDNGKKAATVHPFQVAISYNNTDFPGNPES